MEEVLVQEGFCRPCIVSLLNADFKISSTRTCAGRRSLQLGMVLCMFDIAQFLLLGVNRNKMFLSHGPSLPCLEINNIMYGQALECSSLASATKAILYNSQVRFIVAHAFHFLYVPFVVC